MANWNTLKTAVANIINTNGNQTITGQLLQNVLSNIITNVGENATFVDIASPSTNPGAPDGNVFYLATTAGTYNNFGGIKVEKGEAAILLWKGSWIKKASGLVTEEANNTLLNDVNSNRYGFNVTVNGLIGGTHTLQSAIKDVPLKYRMLGQKITFYSEKGKWETYHNTSLSFDDYENINAWDIEEGVTQLSGNITVNNKPDNEDLTAGPNNNIKFADKEYNLDTFSGLGRIYLRKNVVNGVNTLTNNMLAKANTVYIIQYDYDLQNTEISIPEGCILDFQGGSISNGQINLNGCYIESRQSPIFKNIIANGLIKNRFVETSWFDIDLTGTIDCTDLLQLCATLSITNAKPLNFAKGTYKISSTITFQNGNWQFRGINGNDSTIILESESSIPAILVPNGSGKEAKATIKDLYFTGTPTTTGIELRGACQVFIENCYFYTNRYGVVYSNNVGSGTFTEGCIVEKSRFAASCLTALRYYRGAGNDSFHGSGIKDCWIDTPSGYPAIEIGERCLPYNAPLDFRCLKQGSDAVITRVATADLYPNFYGSISIEAYSCTICSGGNVFFMGTINVLGRATNGTLSVCERIEKRGPNYNNVAAFIPKNSARAGDIEAGASVAFNSSYIWVINFPNGHANIEVRTTRPAHGGNTILAAPIVCYNQAWIESNITITMADGKFTITNKSSAPVRYIAIGTYNNPDPYSYYF